MFAHVWTGHSLTFEMTGWMDTAGWPSLVSPLKTFIVKFPTGDQNGSPLPAKKKRTEEASLEVLALLLSADVRFLTNGIINQTMILRFVLTRLNATVHALWTTT